MEDGLSSSSPGTDRRALRVALERALARDPLFSPITEISLDAERTLGEGGMGVVRLVTDRRLGRRAALKLLKESAGETRVRRFLREASIMARLDHPGIPPIHEVGRTTDGVHFLLMRFVDGRSLAEVLEGKGPALAVRDLLAILVKVAEAVAYAHSKRIVHRDLKPSNVMIGSFGEVLVMDWGLARDLGESTSEDAILRSAPGTATPPVASDSALGETAAGSRLTQADSLLGTLGYMAPEQARGEEIGPQADVFSLGAILAEVLTGSPPIAGETTVVLLSETIEGKVVLPRARRPSVPRELDAIAARALAASTTSRYESATAFAFDLRAYLEGRKIAGYRYGPVEEARKLVLRHPAFVAAAAAAVLVSTIAALAVFAKNLEIARKNDDLLRNVAAREQAEREREAAEKEREKATSARKRVEEARELLAEAGRRFRQGARPEDVKKLVKEAVLVDRTEATLLEAGRVLASAGETDAARELLRACADEFSPGYAALFALHEVEWGVRANVDVILSKPLKELVARARARHEENEYTALAAAMGAIAQRDYERAAKEAERAILKAPRLASAHVVLSLSRYMTGDVEGASRESDLAVDADPGSVLALNCRGCMRAFAGDHEGAIKDFTRLLTLVPQNAYVWSNRAKSRLERGDVEGAIADGTKAIEAEPDEAVGWEIRGNARFKRHDLAGALADTSQAIKLTPKRAAAWSNRAMVRATQTDMEGALADMTRAVELEPTAENYERRGRIRGGMGDAKGAVADAAKATELAPRSVSAWALLGGVRAEAGDLEGAIAASSKAIALDAKHWQAWNNRALAELKKGDLDASERDIARAMDLTTSEAEVFLNRGLLRGERGDFRGAIADLTRSLEVRPLWDAQVNRGVYREKTGDVDGAIADFTLVIDALPDIAAPLRLRGLARARKGDAPGAIADLERFLKVSKNESESAEARAKIADLRGKK